MSCRLNPKEIITHRIPLEEVADAYHIFSSKLDNCIKPILIPPRAHEVRAVAAPYLLTGVFLSRDESACPERAWRFCILPHVRRATLRAAIAELAATAH